MLSWDHSAAPFHHRAHTLAWGCKPAACSASHDPCCCTKWAALQDNSMQTTPAHASCFYAFLPPCRSLLFMSRLPASYAVWMGHIATPEEIRARYAVDEVHYVDEMADVLSSLSPPCLHLLCSTNSDRSLGIATWGSQSPDVLHAPYCTRMVAWPAVVLFCCL
jgi:hypothetical protein